VVAAITPPPAAPAPALVAAITPRAEPAATVVAPITTAPAPGRKWKFPWKAWTLTGLLAGGAVATGVVAWQSQHDLDGQRTMFPADYDEIDYQMRKTRGFALASDGLLVGTAIMAAISLYLTYRDPN
jgi:hypothetical protein